MRYLATLLFALVVAAQPAPQQPLNTQRAQQLMTRSVQLMESGGVALPELARAGAPLIENARQALANARSTSSNLTFYNVFLSNVRAYLFVSDSLPKPPNSPIKRGSSCRNCATISAGWILIFRNCSPNATSRCDPRIATI